MQNLVESLNLVQVVLLALKDKFRMSNHLLNIPSPCKGVCRIDEPSQLCEGCMRTIDEITRWSRMDSDQKLAVLTACIERQQMPNKVGNSDKSASMADGVPGSASEG